jgi:hypothetical protein
MNTFHEKLLFGFAALTSTGFSMLGAIMTDGEARWLYVTLAASSMTSGFLALMFKKQDEAIRLVVGRCGFAVLGGVLATRPIVHQLGFVKITETDIISLAFISAMTCIATFFVGFAGLLIVERQSPQLAEKWLKKLEP